MASLNEELLMSESREDKGNSYDENSLDTSKKEYRV
jgi:hypothetical protein